MWTNYTTPLFGPMELKIHRSHLSAINTPRFVREVPQKKAGRSLAQIEDKSQESQGTALSFQNLRCMCMCAEMNALYPELKKSDLDSE